MSKIRRKRMDSMIFELETGEIESSSSGEDDLPNDTPKTDDVPNRLSPKISHNPIALETFSESINNNDSEILETSPGTASIEGDSNSQSNMSAPKIDIPDNRTPLIMIKFKDKITASAYKAEIKRFLKKLLKSHEYNETFESDSETELNVWPSDDTSMNQDVDHTDSMFIMDTNPASIYDLDVPAYSHKYDVLDNSTEVKKKPAPQRVQECFNCDGNHTLRDCQLPKNYNKINQKRKAMMNKQSGRYHLEEQGKGGSSEGELVAGRISGALRRALSLQKNQLPIHIYRMRLLGYPPGWLINAQITHSGIAMFDSMGKTVADPEDEEGEIAEIGSKDKYDIKKILDFPGFNIPASSKYIDESEAMEVPPMSEADSKTAMLERLAPRLARAYKKKKLALGAPTNVSNPGDTSLTTDMDIDEGEPPLPPGPFVPPLPVEDLPLPPPPPPEITPPPPSVELPPGEESTRSSISPSLDDLESHKIQLLAALEAKSPVVTDAEVSQASPFPSEETENNVSADVAGDTPTKESAPFTPKMGEVRKSKLGTPMVSSTTPYSKLPDEEKFAKDICDVINFENLPDSTGKYEQMSGIIKKVRSAVLRIQQEI